MVGRSAYYDKCISAPEEAKLGFVRRSRATRSWNLAQEGVVVIQLFVTQLFVTRILKKVLDALLKAKKARKPEQRQSSPKPKL